MKTRLYSMIGMTCLAALMSNGLAKPAAAQPETETITFGVLVNYTGDNFLDLSEVIGPDTNGIFLDKWLPTSTSLEFHAASPDCEDIVVAGTTWSSVSFAKIINKGGPVDATIFSNSFFPPDRYMLLEKDIIDVRACWLKQSSGDAYVQAGPDGSTFAGFFIVTGKFRVDN